jgi:Kef-type K+ transport system membrane component KefB/nucleotide-binding universal stress UspA family protein
MAVADGDIAGHIGLPSRRGSTRTLSVALFVSVAGFSVALAAGETPAPPSEALFIGQIVALLVVGGLMGEGMQRIGQPAIMGQLLAGIFLGPSVFGAILPDIQHHLFPPVAAQKAMLDAVSQLGITLLLLLTGMEMDLALIAKMRRAAASISIAGIAVPFIAGALLGEFLPDSLLPKPELRLITSLFLGTALSVSSVKIVAAVVRNMGFMRRRVGQLIVAAAIVDDTLGWIIIAVIFGLALHGGVEPWSILISIAGTLLFLVISLTLGQRIVSISIRWVNDRFVSEFPVITAILAIAGCMALITSAIGVHTVLGAFVAGILIGRSPILTHHIRERLQGLTTALFMPVFFGAAGLSADLTALRDPKLLLVAIGLVAIASLGKFGGAFLGGSIASLPSRESLALAFGMNARGSTEVVIATIGLSMGALSQTLYSMIVAMAVITTTAMPPMLRWALARLPISPEEKERLALEELEAKGFVASLERLLVAADKSANGQLASRVAGLLSVSRGMPLTVLEVESGDRSAPVTLEEAARGGATAAVATNTDKKPAEPDITTRRPAGAAEAAVALEARKGYDLLFVGLDDATSTTGSAQLAASFVGPVCVVEARGIHAMDAVGTALNMLVPISGTPESHRALEIAVALARAGSTTITLLFVEPPARRSSSHAFGQRLLGARGMDLREATHFADQYNVRTRRVSRSGVAVEDAISHQIGRGHHNLVLLGVRPRSSDVSFYGTVASEVLGRAACSVMLVSG